MSRGCRAGIVEVCKLAQTVAVEEQEEMREIRRNPDDKSWY
jgi:hypothetical protein